MGGRILGFERKGEKTIYVIGEHDLTGCFSNLWGNSGRRTSTGDAITSYLPLRTLMHITKLAYLPAEKRFDGARREMTENDVI